MATTHRRTPTRKRRPAVAGTSGRPIPRDTPAEGFPDEPEQTPLEPDGDTSDAPTPGGDESTSKHHRTKVFRVRENAVKLLAAVTVLCGTLAIGLGISAHVLLSGAGRNAALVDTTQTRAVSEQVAGAVRTAFSYNHADPAATQRSAQEKLVGSAVRQYNTIFEQVKQVPPEQRLTFTTTVRAVGVTRLDGDHAQLLVFVDQQGIRADTEQRRSGSAQLDISAQRFGADWKISDIRVL